LIGIDTLGIIGAISAVGIGGVGQSVAVVVHLVVTASIHQQSFLARTQLGNVIADLLAFVALVTGAGIVVGAHERFSGALAFQATVLHRAEHTVVAFHLPHPGRRHTLGTERIAASQDANAVEGTAVTGLAVALPRLAFVPGGAGVSIVTIQIIGEIGVLAEIVQAEIRGTFVLVIAVVIGLAAHPGIGGLRQADRPAVGPSARYTSVSRWTGMLVRVTGPALQVQPGIAAGGKKQRRSDE
jgi:hypothetical protein